MRKIKWRLGLLLSAASMAGAAELPDWQGKDSWYGFKEYCGWDCVGGLSFQYSDAHVPRLKVDIFGTPEEARNGAMPARKPVLPRLLQNDYLSFSFKDEGPYMQGYWSVGHIGQGRVVERTTVEKSWCHVAVVYPGYRMYVSRLSPAVVFESDADLMVFSNPAIGELWPILYNAWWEATRKSLPVIMPTMCAYGHADGRVTLSGMPTPGKSDALEMDLFGEGVRWMLFWYGNKFTTSKGPEVYGPDETKPVEYQGDNPVLFVFSNPPKMIEASSRGDGLAFYFEESAGRIAVVKPFERHLQLVDTEGWAKIDMGSEPTLREDIAKQCRQWAERLAAFPLDVKETWSVGEDGRVRIREEFTYLPIYEAEESGEAAEYWMPVPPIWALAAEEGFPLEFSGELRDSGVYTYIGPYKGILGKGSYEVVLPSMRKYWQERRETKAAGAADPEWLQPVVRELENEVEKVLDAGHLAPWFQCVLNWWGQVHWRYSCDTLYHLSQTLDALSDPLRKRLLAYITNEDAAYPPDTAKCFLRYNAGAHRERTVVTPYMANELTAHFLNDENYGATATYWQLFGGIMNSAGGDWYRLNGMLPPESLYAVACLYEAVPHEALPDLRERWPRLRAIIAPHLCRLDWASGSFLAGRAPYSVGPILAVGQSGVSGMNRWFAALVGLARLASQVNDAETRDMAEYLLGRAAISRFAQAKFVHNLYRNGLQTLTVNLTDKQGREVLFWAQSAFEILQDTLFFRWTTPEQDARQIAAMNEFIVLAGPHHNFSPSTSIILFQHLTPELGRFLAEHARKETDAFISAMDRLPEWYVTENEDFFGGEQAFEFPDCSQQLFMAKLWIQGVSPSEMVKYIDVPWTRVGDYYHIQKLAELVKAARGVEWK